MEKSLKEQVYIKWKWILSGLFILGIVYKCSINHEYNELMEKALAVKKTHPEMKIFDGDVEPEMPDRSENDFNVYGIDSNKNGLRDDVEIWINRSYANPNIRMAMKQKHRVFQSIMTIKEGDNETSNRLFQEEDNAVECLNTFFESFEEFKKHDKNLVKLTRNVRKRSLQYNNGNFNVTAPIGGPVLDKIDAQKKFCKFEVIKD